MTPTSAHDRFIDNAEKFIGNSLSIIMAIVGLAGIGIVLYALLAR